MYQKDFLLGLYSKMLLARRFEERAGQAYGQRKIQGFCHLYIGQEAVAVGINEALRPTDAVLTGYRDHVHPLIRGADPGMLYAELFGKATGYSCGKGGSMHLIDIEHRFYGGYGIVGGQIPLGAGLAFAAKYRGEDQVVVCSFGDAAANQGVMWETFNIASKWKLPVLYVVENNKYGMGTDIHRVSAEPDVHKRMAAFRMRGDSVDGMDVLAVYEKSKEMIDEIRSGNGPALLEAYTYRFRGHSMSDAATYRTKAEVEEEKSRDPIETLGAKLEKEGHLNAAAKEALEAKIAAEINAALAFAEESPEPELSELERHTYVEPGEPDEHPRERVRGVKVDWPTHKEKFSVTWEIEPKTEAAPGKGS